jgi:hypothetical protein
MDGWKNHHTAAIVNDVRCPCLRLTDAIASSVHARRMSEIRSTSGL